MGKPCCVFLRGCRAEAEQGHGGRPREAVQRACGRPSRSVPSPAAPWEQPAQPDSRTAPLQQFGSFVTKHREKCSVKAAQHFPCASLPQGCSRCAGASGCAGTCLLPAQPHSPQCPILTVKSGTEMTFSVQLQGCDQDITVAQRGFFSSLYFKENRSTCCHSVPMQIPEQ